MAKKKTQEAAPGQSFAPSNMDMFLKQMGAQFKRNVSRVGVNRPAPFGPRAKMKYDKVGTVGPWFERPGVVYPEMIRNFVRRVEQLKIIHNRRRKQVSSFGWPSRHRYDRGWKIVMTNAHEHVDDAAIHEMKFLRDFVENCGNEFDQAKRREVGRDRFSNFLGKITDDTLTFDQICVELEPLAYGDGLAGFYAVDAATIRLVDRDKFRNIPENDSDFGSAANEGFTDEHPPSYVQLIDRQPQHWFSTDDMIWFTRNGSTDIFQRGYGEGESEMALMAAWCLYLFMEINHELLDENMIPPGLLYVSGAPTTLDWAEQLRTELEGGGGRKRFTLPVWATDAGTHGGEMQAKWIPFYTWEDIQNERMAAYFTSMVCAAHGMTPEEVGMKSFSSGESSLSGKDTEERIAAQKDAGIIPLVREIQDLMTEIVQRVLPSANGRYKFEFVNLDDRDIQWEKQTDRLVLTIDEMRAEKDMPPHEDPTMGAAPVDPAKIGLYMQSIGMGEPEDGEWQRFAESQATHADVRSAARETEGVGEQ